MIISITTLLFLLCMLVQLDRGSMQDPAWRAGCATTVAMASC